MLLVTAMAMMIPLVGMVLCRSKLSPVANFDEAQ